MDRKEYISRKARERWADLKADPKALAEYNSVRRAKDRLRRFRDQTDPSVRAQNALTTIHEEISYLLLADLTQASPQRKAVLAAQYARAIKRLRELELRL